MVIDMVNRNVWDRFWLHIIKIVAQMLRGGAEYWCFLGVSYTACRRYWIVRALLLHSFLRGFVEIVQIFQFLTNG